MNYKEILFLQSCYVILLIVSLLTAIYTHILIKRVGSLADTWGILRDTFSVWIALSWSAAFYIFAW